MKSISCFVFFLIPLWISAQNIPGDRVVAVDELATLLKKEVRLEILNGKTNTVADLAAYFRDQFSKRFFYNYESFEARLEDYKSLYDNMEDHKERGLDHLGKYADSTQWVLPFNYLNGKAVDAYALRHLARQHKMVDIAISYFGEQKNPASIRYFENQLRSLNAALIEGQYEKIEDGNGVYEVFRSGYRILNWLWIHNMFLGETEYADFDQLTTIATLLQHGQHLYERNEEFRSGNHQTRGMSALAMLAILFRDFEGTDLWYERAMSRLSEHLEKEINPDGFQFERSIHYHMSDINNYYYVYQLAKINDIKVPKAWEEKLRSLFTTLVKVAYPDKSAPVLQDDTEIPWAEKNDISGAMTLGYLLFEDPVFGYFATDKVDEKMYWFLNDRQVALLDDIPRKKPSIGSVALEDTHYYIMREGWSPNDKMMIISAGLDPEKPDHQHGDMLGIQAMANGQVLLPNYQVRYSLKDFELFKNSLVKNVALVDDELQGKQWTSNKGGSGFGKFKELPNPEVIAWKKEEAFDFFAGTHDGFKKNSVDYTRQVLFVKDDFWIVKDDFTSLAPHQYKQVWQGHYTSELGPGLIRANFPDASGLDILQIHKPESIKHSGARGKNWSIVSSSKQKVFSFLTILFPYRGYGNRIDETSDLISFNNWVVNNADWKVSGINSTTITKNKEGYMFGVRKLELNDLIIELSAASDLYIQREADKIQIYLLGTQKRVVSLKQGEQKMEQIELDPGEKWEINI